jgi:hypothetical protein
MPINRVMPRPFSRSLWAVVQADRQAIRVETDRGVPVALAGGVTRELAVAPAQDRAEPAGRSVRFRAWRHSLRR